MDIINFQKGEILAERESRAGRWYLILDGSVCQKYELTEIILEKDAAAGIFEYNTLMCSYIAASDGKAAVFDVEDAAALHGLLDREQNLRHAFTEAALKQYRQMFWTYTKLEEKSKQFYSVVQSLYQEYKKLCSAFSLGERSITGMECFKPLTLQHKAELWELQSSNALSDKYVKECVSFLEQETDLSVGMIMSCMRQMRHVAAAITEMDGYLLQHKEFLFAESENDIFSLYFDLAIRAGMIKQDVGKVHKRVNLICEYAQKIKLYDIHMIEKRIRQYEGYDFMLGSKQEEDLDAEKPPEEPASALAGGYVWETVMKSN